jgi:hypothetical protein
MPQREIKVDLSSDEGEDIGIPNVLANSVEQTSSEQQEVQNDTRRNAGIAYLRCANNKTLYLSFEVPWREYGRPRRCFAPDFI